MADKKAQLAFLILVTVILLRLPAFSSRLVSNVAWLYLARTNIFEPARDMQDIWDIQALNLFRSAARLDKANWRAFLGAGIVLVTRGNESDALASWQRADISPGTLTELARQYRVNKRWNEALIYYRNASRLETRQPNTASILAGGICQRTFTQPDLLNATNQKYCQDFFRQNGNNLIVNGQFDETGATGWSRIYFSKVGSFVDRDDQIIGKPPPSIVITGKGEGRHGGVFQGITLPGGATVRYSAWIKVSAESDTKIIPLYFGADQDGKPIGNSLRDASGEMAWIISKDMEWTYLERTFQVPKTDRDLLRFFPVLLIGYGTVWVDDVRLELLSPEK